MKKTFRFFTVALISFGMVMAVSCNPTNTDDPDNPGGVDPTETGDPVLMDENFNAGLPSGWTTTDEDGDGLTWVLGSQIGGVYLVDDASLTDANGGDMVCSGSYSNVVGALTPDNKLTTPQIHIPGAGGYKLTWQVQAQDASYPAEHYGVLVNGTEVFAETLTAKKAPGNWYTRTVSLDDFKGKDVTISFRHYNCTDMFILNLDNVKVANNI